MANIYLLPDLIIRGITMKYSMQNKGVSGFKMDLSHLHISSRWRFLAMPIVYMAVRIGESEKEHLEKIPSQKWRSNIGLIAELGLEYLVRKVEIFSMWDNIDFANLLGPLLDMLNMRSVDWPQEYGFHLNGTIRDKLHLSVNDYLHQSLSSELLAKMADVLQNFALRFPHIIAVEIRTEFARGTARQFTNQLVNTFIDRLVGLRLYVNTPVDLEYFPISLKNLGFWFKPHTGTFIPKICNPSRLESWEIYEIPSNCLWEDLFNIPDGAQSFEFSSLHTLSLSYTACYSYDDNGSVVLNDNNMRTLPSSHRVQLHLPKLTNLTIRKPLTNNSAVFSPKTISTLMKCVDLALPFDDLEHFSTLPIMRIRHLTLYLQWQQYDSLECFYISTNRLLGDMDNSRGTTYIKLDIDRLKLDMKQLRWHNVTKLHAKYLSASTLMPLLTKLPLVKQVQVVKLECDRYDLLEFMHISLVEYLEIGDVNSSWYLQAKADFLTDILIQHSSIKSLALPKQLVQLTERLIRNACSIYPHWEQIHVYAVNI